MGASISMLWLVQLPHKSVVIALRQLSVQSSHVGVLMRVALLEMVDAASDCCCSVLPGCKEDDRFDQWYKADLSPAVLVPKSLSVCHVC